MELNIKQYPIFFQENKMIFKGKLYVKFFEKFIT